VSKFDVGWGFAQDPTAGVHSAPPDPIAVFKGEGRGEEEGKGGKGRQEWMGGEGK